MKKIDKETLRERIERIDTLPTIPNILKRLLKMLENQKVSLSEISSFISQDPVITTKVLKMVNSPVYGFPGRISSVNQAVILLGLNVVKGLLLGVSVFELMRKAMIGLWEHSLACAITARLMAKKKGLKEPDELSVAGLLHDIGKVILALQFSEQYEKIIHEAEERGIVIMELEKISFDLTHATVAEWMTKKWSFPRNLIEIIGYHHKPHLSKNFLVETSIVHLADILVRGRGFGFAGDRSVPAVHPNAWTKLSFKNEEIKDILNEVEDSMDEAEELFVN